MLELLGFEQKLGELTFISPPDSARCQSRLALILCRTSAPEAGRLVDTCSLACICAYLSPLRCLVFLLGREISDFIQTVFLLKLMYLRLVQKSSVSLKF